MLNLAIIYYYEFGTKNYKNEIIELLIKSSILGLHQPGELLSIILIRKYNKDHHKIDKKLNKYEYITNEYKNDIYQLIDYIDSNCLIEDVYEFYKITDFIYDENQEIIEQTKIKEFHTTIKKETQKMHDINFYFYEGFGIDI